MPRYRRLAILAVCTFSLAFAQSRAQSTDRTVRSHRGWDRAERHSSNARRPGAALGYRGRDGSWLLLRSRAFPNRCVHEPDNGRFLEPCPLRIYWLGWGQLACYYGRVDEGASSPGVATLYPQADGKFVAVFVAEFTPAYAECTGRFSKLTGGSFIMVATTEPFVLGSTDPVAYWWQGQGTLTFQHAK